ncbi:uncharacterized protein LOC132698145 isoform X2 [Cylas formicarius]|uniref:uncharacterized protein LOC132698145 isoform X2 n=1 Tax=Cylas formicarius TaxID=197179 RepID=UPI002958B897|nr:uncharacterized protein LOC132698145 isoform X2 [Cylas formicarius]
MKMATYAGMSLRGEVRESVSLDEDDLSDVEDEVFIRDGKNGYKLAEEMNVKRPLMAPRRKALKSDAGSRLKQKHNCRVFWKPCCYVFAALSVLIGLIALVVVLVSLYPLPLDKLRDWVISTAKIEKTPKLLPCSNLKITDVWTVNLPTLITDSPVRSLDVNGDGIDDILFGFGTGNHDVLPPDIFCLIFMGVPPPCQGGVMALNGTDGEMLWKLWINDTIFSLQCSADLNGDNVMDCLAIGEYGTILTIDSKTGSTIWQLNTRKLDIFVGNFIADCNGDNISDVITSHSSLEGSNDGHIEILSGKNGAPIVLTALPNRSQSYFMPEVLQRDENVTYILYGTGSPNWPGNLSAVPLQDFIAGNLLNKSNVIYEDKHKGMVTQPVLVDITGDGVSDIVASMYNSTVVAIDGRTFQQIWNYSLGNAVTNVSPTPGYFNFDNVTDFLVIYQQYDNILNYNYTQAFIIDGKTGQPIYNPVSGGVVTQMGGLTLRMESYGYDLFLFWTSECSRSEPLKKYAFSTIPTAMYDECKKQFNSTTIHKLNALDEFHQPPGVTIYSSLGRETLEYNVKPVMYNIRKYYKNRAKLRFPNDNVGQSEIPKVYSGDPVPIGIRKYGKSSFRHKDRPGGIIKDYASNGESDTDVDSFLDPLNEHEDPTAGNSPDFWQNQIMGQDLQSEFKNYDDTIPYNQNQMIFDDAGQQQTNVRDPRDKDAKKSKKKNLSDKIYGYHNLRLSKNRLLRDDESLPTDIIRETYFKNEENRLKKSRFEQRDVNLHADRSKDDEEIKRILEEEKRAVLNGSLTLWDLETEKEIQEKRNGFYKREKRGYDALVFDSVVKITSVGTVLSSLNNSNASNSIDVVFIKYWQSDGKPIENLLNEDIEQCVSERTNKSSSNALDQKKICLEEQTTLKDSFKYWNELSRLKVSQMTVYRLRIECECESVKANQFERCVRFLPGNRQNWSSYLGKFGNAIFINKAKPLGRT